MVSQLAYLLPVRYNLVWQSILPFIWKNFGYFDSRYAHVLLRLSRYVVSLFCSFMFVTKVN